MVQGTAVDQKLTKRPSFLALDKVDLFLAHFEAFFLSF
jgi:hypothetical protein